MQITSPRIPKRSGLQDGDVSLLALVGLLIVGVLFYFPVSPGTYLADIPEILLPLGIVGGLIPVVYFVWLHDDSSRLDGRFGLYGWLGAVVGGAAGVWLGVHDLSIGVSFAHVYDEALTILSIGIAIGVLAGLTTTRTRQLTSSTTADPDRGAVLAESTWANRSAPCPIVVELVNQLSELDGTDPFELEALSTYIDPEVFSALRTGGDSPWQLLFYTDTYEVRVNSQGTITVYDQQHSAAASAVRPSRSASDERAVPGSSIESSLESRSKVASKSPADAVYEAVAGSEGVEAAELPPLEEWVHPSTLEALTGPWTQLDGRLDLRYVWYRVTVYPTGEVRVRG